jgi:hypothetical protein
MRADAIDLIPVNHRHLSIAAAVVVTNFPYCNAIPAVTPLTR